VATADQRGQILVESLRRRVRNDDVEGVVDRRPGTGALMVILDDVADRLALELRGKGNDCGGAAAGRSDATSREVVSRPRARRRDLLEMSVAVHAARKNESARRLNLTISGTEPLGQRHDAPAPDADVGPHRVCSGHDRAVPDHEVELGHRHPPLCLEKARVRSPHRIALGVRRRWLARANDRHAIALERSRKLLKNSIT